MRVLQVFRAPVGGLFRHVRDLARGLDALGHQVALVCDRGTGGEAADKLLQSVATYCSLGVHRIAISRLPGIGDAKAVLTVRELARALNADILHGHGAKGGLAARLAARSLGKPAVYSPHGGSLHYDWSQAAGAAFLGTEWLLARLGSGAIFVCDYERRRFEAKLGLPRWPSTIVHNGLWPEEFTADAADETACDFVFIGDLRTIKGIDIFIEALALLNQKRPATAAIVGDGPQQSEYQELARARGISGRIDFTGRLSTGEALSRGRTLVLPSRSESFPYVVLEAVAQGKPVIASAVGGIPEVLPASCLVPPGDPGLLAKRLEANIDNLVWEGQAAAALRDQVGRRFSAPAMAAKIADFYGVAAMARQSGTVR